MVTKWSQEHHLSTCIQVLIIKHATLKVENFRHLLGCDTIVLNVCAKFE